MSVGNYTAAASPQGAIGLTGGVGYAGSHAANTKGLGKPCEKGLSRYTWGLDPLAIRSALTSASDPDGQKKCSGAPEAGTRGAMDSHTKRERPLMCR